MKKIVLILSILGICKITLAQTNTFPSSGNTGIGTTSLTSSFPPGLSNPGSGTYLEIKSQDVSYPSGLFIRRLDGVSNIGVDLTSDNNNGVVYMDSRWNNDASSMQFRMKTLGSPVTAMTFSGTGNVGIGTTSPSTKLQVEGAIYARGAETNTVNPGGNTGSIIFNDSYSAIRAATNHSLNIDVYNGGSQIAAMTILQNGNTGIGTTSPSEKLAVNGKIRAKEIKVETGWSDFVFEPSYKLRSLRETEEFIKGNKHLPEIPSAKEVAENGINLGEMNAKLLQKIEELTLHMIRMDKENEKLGKIVADQQLKIDSLESR